MSVIHEQNKGNCNILIHCSLGQTPLLSVSHGFLYLFWAVFFLYCLPAGLIPMALLRYKPMPEASGAILSAQSYAGRRLR